jgi:6-phosphogluconolactonase
VNGGRPPAPGVQILAGPEELARRAADEVLRILGEAVDQRSIASWVLAGGSTPRRLYELLADRPRSLDWRRVELFWGDERCVDRSSEASNFALARDTLLTSLPLASDRVHRMRGELPPAEGARLYARDVERALVRAPFDLVLLGLGVDGHVASLFPGALPPSGQLAAAIAAAARPRWRVTMTPAALARTRHLVYLVSGRDKAKAVRRALDPGREADLVTDQIRPPAGETLWLLDREAAEGLSGPVVA